MPGHEGTTRSDLDDYSISGQAQRIHQVTAQHHITSADGCRDVQGCGDKRDAEPHEPCLVQPRTLPSQAARATDLKLLSLISLMTPGRCFLSPNNAASALLPVRGVHQAEQKALSSGWHFHGGKRCRRLCCSVPRRHLQPDPHLSCRWARQGGEERASRSRCTSPQQCWWQYRLLVRSILKQFVCTV